MNQGLHVFDRVKSILIQEVDWTVGFTLNNNKRLQVLYRHWAKDYDEEMPKKGTRILRIVCFVFILVFWTLIIYHFWLTNLFHRVTQNGLIGGDNVSTM